MGWRMLELAAVPQNGHTVFSAFSCGGGSSMGYKLAGFEVVGNCEIDPAMAQMYQRNLHPRHPYIMDIRDFNRMPAGELPPALFSLDILDGSPPCSVFSMAGNREADWGRKKRFREGQAPQTLDDLFFEFIKLAGKLRPRIVVAENVKGLLVGKARGYVHDILQGFAALGYRVQLFCLNAASMGVPQSRERVFFVGSREDVPKLRLDFHEKRIPFGAVRTARGISSDSFYANLLRYKQRGDTQIADINQRRYGKERGFTTRIAWDDAPAPTITSNGTFFRACDDMVFSAGDFIACQTFPEDYDFAGQSVQYVCGMSVPPVMMQHIAQEIGRQWP